MADDRSCATCAWATVGEFARCHAPDDFYANAVGFSGPKFCAEQRAWGWPFYKLFGICGRGGRWWASKERSATSLDEAQREAWRRGGILMREKAVERVEAMAATLTDREHRNLLARAADAIRALPLAGLVVFLSVGPSGAACLGECAPDGSSAAYYGEGMRRDFEQDSRDRGERARDYEVQQQIQQLRNEQEDGGWRR